MNCTPNQNANMSAPAAQHMPHNMPMVQNMPMAQQPPMSMAMPMVHETYAVPGLGDKAPDFTAQTTDGIKSLSDYKGQWVVLFSHPGDFTPVSKKQH